MATQEVAKLINSAANQWPSQLVTEMPVDEKLEVLIQSKDAVLAP